MSLRPIEEMIPAYIRGLVPYEPGRPIEEVERELQIAATKLASNENPLGPSPLAMEAARNFLRSAHRYPDGAGFYLRQKLATRLGVAIEKVVLGSGCGELIHTIASTLLDQGDEAVTSEGSFPMYYTAVLATGAKLIRVPLRNFTYDLEAMAHAVTPQTKLVFLANPNNPTGTIFTCREFDAFLDAISPGVLVVLDEAYFEYVQRSDYSRSLDAVRAGKNVLVLRTFSKVYGMAGMRIGYGIGPEGFLREMNKLRLPFNTTSVSQVAALAALDDAAHVRASIENNRAGHAQLAGGFQRFGVKFLPSAANFIFFESTGSAKELAERFLTLGVIVRPLEWMGFPEALRVTIGTRQENERFLDAFARLLAPDTGSAAAPGKSARETPR